MKNTILKTVLLIFSGLWLVSCEDVIDVKLDQGKSELAVDALVMFDDGPQTIRLTQTGPYFDKNKANGASGATVRISSNLGKSYVLIENPAQPGNYQLDSLKGIPGEIFTLRIDYKGESFEATSVRVRGTPIDTLYPEFRKAEFRNKEGYYANLVAKDSVGTGDFYWIRTTLNGMPNRLTSRLNQAISADGAFDLGTSDGLDFIYPIRNSINLREPYLTEDVLAVELLSIDYENFRFLREMEKQLNNRGLFAEPIANVKGNIKNVNPNSTTKAQGCFGVARVSRQTIVFP